MNMVHRRRGAASLVCAEVRAGRVLRAGKRSASQNGNTRP